MVVQHFKKRDRWRVQCSVVHGRGHSGIKTISNIHFMILDCDLIFHTLMGFFKDKVVNVFESVLQVMDENLGEMVKAYVLYKTPCNLQELVTENEQRSARYEIKV